MINRWLASLGVLLACVALSAQPAKSPEQQFQDAVANYHAGKFAEAAAELRALLPQAPKSYELHELLGLTYAAQSQDSLAVEQFQIAVQFNSESAPARANLAAALARTGKLDAAEEQGRKALALEPQDYDANHNLAEFYIQAHQLSDALPLLEAAQRLRPAAYENGYDLALTYLLSGKPDQARQQAEALIQQKDAGELHNLLGRVDEAQGKYIDAANEFARAAHMDPSEDNLFVWASELLLHRAYEPAIEVFRQGSQRYPNSPRLLVGLGMAQYSHGDYEDSIRSLLAGADLDPTDPRCYLFLSKAYLISPSQAPDVIERFRRYAELEPRNATAQYYYALSLSKGRRLGNSTANDQQVQALLEKSIALDDAIAESHLQLGILYNDQHEYAKALSEYERALQLNDRMSDAHYRLGQYYVHSGEKDKAQREFDLSKQLQAEHQAEFDKERADVQQFVVSAKSEGK